MLNLIYDILKEVYCIFSLQIWLWERFVLLVMVDGQIDWKLN